MEQDTARLLAIKSEMIKTTATPGFTYMQGVMNNIITDLTQEALDAAFGQGEEKRCVAKGAQKAFDTFLATINKLKAFEPPNEAEEDFTSLAIN
jgi:hypothetical protein